MNKNIAKTNIAKLVKKYQQTLEANKIRGYNEAQTRNEFIEPLFEFLGWDMRNLNHSSEVITEENVSKGRVDLAFQLNSIPVMFLEAKSMKVDLDDWKWAQQAINYSWNKGVSWAVLTDFEGIKVFNAEVPPKDLYQNLFFELKWSEYTDKFDQLWMLSKTSFEENIIDEQA
ncbi:MAG: type I restriction enzyme HsdR N-terminal domain-containing protein, partial [bacterium]|nr:type I restriction enzyme HsdR N-terminal domain-containing protein [bacterium]